MYKKAQLGVDIEEDGWILINPEDILNPANYNSSDIHIRLGGSFRDKAMYLPLLPDGYIYDLIEDEYGGTLLVARKGGEV
jgi:hypothetical protein